MGRFTCSHNGSEIKECKDACALYVVFTYFCGTKGTIGMFSVFWIFPQGDLPWILPSNWTDFNDGPPWFSKVTGHQVCVEKQEDNTFPSISCV